MSYGHVTICFSLPRSRSQWLTWYYGRALQHAWHDPLALCVHPLDLRERIDHTPPGRIFIADTSAILFHSAITASLPGAQFVYVLRDPREVCASLKRQTHYPRTRLIGDMHTRLLRESQEVEKLSVSQFADLDRKASMWWPSITGFSHAAMPPDFWSVAAKTRVDTPVHEQIAYPEKRYALMLHREPTNGC